MGADPEKLMTGDEVAEWLGVSPRSVQEWATTGEMPSLALGVGRRITRRYRRSDLEAWLKQRTRGVTVRPGR